MLIRTPAPDAASRRMAADRRLSQLADDMRDVESVKGSCDAHDLVLRGHPKDYVETHWQAASLRAFQASEVAL